MNIPYDKHWVMQFFGNRDGMAPLEIQRRVVQAPTSQEALQKGFEGYEGALEFLVQKIQFETEINGYHVLLDIDMDGVLPHEEVRVTGCWISRKCFSASLEAMKSEGVLVDGQDRDWPVSADSQVEIEEWADSLGYGGDSHLPEGWDDEKPKQT